MPGKARPRTMPIEVISKSPANRERAWYKGARTGLARASIDRKEKARSVIFRKASDGETIQIHTHPSYTKNWKPRMLPSFRDIRTLISFVYSGKVKSEVIAVRDGEKVSGYVFLKIRKKDEPLHKQFFFDANIPFWNLVKQARFNKKYPAMTRYRQYLKQREHSANEAKLFREAVEEMENLGLKLRFVPNRKEGYYFNGSRFDKK